MGRICEGGKNNRGQRDECTQRTAVVTGTIVMARSHAYGIVRGVERTINDGIPIPKRGVRYFAASKYLHTFTTGMCLVDQRQSMALGGLKGK